MFITYWVNTWQLCCLQCTDSLAWLWIGCAGLDCSTHSPLAIKSANYSSSKTSKFLPCPHFSTHLCHSLFIGKGVRRKGKYFPAFSIAGRWKRLADPSSHSLRFSPLPFIFCCSNCFFLLHDSGTIIMHRFEKPFSLQLVDTHSKMKQNHYGEADQGDKFWGWGSSFSFENLTSSGR